MTIHEHVHEHDWPRLLETAYCTGCRANYWDWSQAEILWLKGRCDQLAKESMDNWYALCEAGVENERLRSVLGWRVDL